MATPNPLASTFKSPHGDAQTPPTVSARKFLIGGITTTVYGLDELLPSQNDIACLWLLHARLQQHEVMEPIAAAAIQAWQAHLNATGDQAPKKGLIAVAFDQRNHGSRLVSRQANEAWRGGNPNHAQDMFSIYEGTACDQGNIQAHLRSYIFISREEKHRAINQNLVLGISLGGHAAWHSLIHNPTISAAVIVIGCPDFKELMYERAVKSKLPVFTSTPPTRGDFFGSEYFPTALLDSVRRTDPASLLMDPWIFTEDEKTSTDLGPDDPPVPHPERTGDLILTMLPHLAHKRILNLAGGADKLVPYWAAWRFLQFLKDASVQDLGPSGHCCGTRLAAMGWFSQGDLKLTDIVYEDVGHEMMPEMLEEAKRFVVQALVDGPKVEKRPEAQRTGLRGMKI